jgi:hypothetical protein
MDIPKTEFFIVFGNSDWTTDANFAQAISSKIQTNYYTSECYINKEKKRIEMKIQEMRLENLHSSNTSPRTQIETYIYYFSSWCLRYSSRILLLVNFSVAGIFIIDNSFSFLSVTSFKCTICGPPIWSNELK